MNLNKLMKQAQKMQEQMTKTQAELEKKTIEVSAGGGKVKVTANGAGEIVAIKIDKEVVDPNDVGISRGNGVKRRETSYRTRQSACAIGNDKITGGLGGLS